MALWESTRNVTVKDCISVEPVSEIGGYRRHTFFTMGQQSLFLTEQRAGGTIFLLAIAPQDQCLCGMPGSGCA